MPPKDDSKKTDDKDASQKPQNEKERNHIQYNERERVQYNKRADEDQIKRGSEGIKNRINQQRRQDNRKQNIVLDKLFTEIVDEEMKEKLQNIDLSENIEEIFPEVIPDQTFDNGSRPSNNKEAIAMTDEDLEGRLALERSVGERRSFRFRADV